MENTVEQENYKIQKPENWAPKIDDNQLIESIKESDFSNKQVEEGRDFCYLLDKVYYTSDNENSEYACVAYTLNEPSNLESASVKDVVVEENETYIIHRISVLREGVLIDKIADTKIKVLDSENQSEGGILSSNKKVNITIKDLRLYDVLITEDSRVKVFTDRDFMRKEFLKYVYVTPSTYWAYGNYKFTFINDRKDPIAYKKAFFRDDEGNVLEPEIKHLKKGERFVIEKQDYINFFDTNREIAPFIDFATDSSWVDLANYIAPLYEEIYSKASLKEFAPKLVEKLDAITDKDEQLQFAIDYVQNHVYYIFNADEMNGHKPQEPSVTYENKQGDCKAKSVLLKVVLDYINVDSSVVLVNFNTDHYITHYLPSLLTFNHVILKINYKGETYFIDATSRDEFGLIENRGFIYFLHYLEVKQNQGLQIREPHKFSYYGINEKVDFSAQNSIGKLKLVTTYKGNRANYMRKYFKNTNKREIVDSWNNFLFYTLNYSNDRNGTDIRTIFKDAVIEIVSDDKKLNEFTIQYNAEIENPYFTDQQQNRFLMYFDRNMVKNGARDFMHTDIPFWHNFDNEKYEVNLLTDQKIDTQEKYTIQESTINNPYFDYTSRKKVTKNGASIYIDYKPLVNLEIPQKDFEEFRNAHHTVADSNFGIGIDIIEQGLLNMLKYSFKKRLK
ncbi:hypothetical protein [Flavobacterium johnsoniae]|uniref:DUF3857 domain-containing protein n=1 Tax=Flavobacterium johnsoniae (strain ATCC 17061 / DSM 2064 / JCM 8514 / BCRC 14874 / CCUG 350202 / NBRC 14942 / NCIMB 11054 / UW101) TaxID=376686 RepID=A5FJM6_FLAJ1|nr:hypothetical protein [Flavobacterium johnsoniae]ABQ04600.1 hypothetical protein Fjoh_1568 [Flavobacterium johnsoniae UW101]OXE97922.1 hypothetical protein B0A63_17485 [Flavobacterium johnsoniae UW101]WQG83604.1 hypothetical protein SR927_10900 [Flavobacterium johnsoniae UW101]SHK27481.1 hypothetical protein SAMN05444146_1002 [Flavobacterium johnsoniae]